MPPFALSWPLAGNPPKSRDSFVSPEADVSALFHELRPPLLRYLRSIGLPVADGEDVAQETFLALFEHLRRDRPRDNLRGWVFRVGRNLALQRLSRAGRRATPEPVEALAETLCAGQELNPEANADWNARQARLMAVVRALPDQDRQCLFLRAEGLRYREIGGALGMSLGSVAASLSRSLAKLAVAADR